MERTGDAGSTLLAEAAEVFDDAVKLRRHLHQHPELGLELPRTQESTLDAIDGLGLTIRTGITSNSIVAVLEGDEPGPTMLLRGDMDALPMPELTDLPFASRTDGMMHACGHDLHTAMLAGAARLLAARRGLLKGRVVFMFQPGEEGYAGAQHMLNEGLLDGVGDVTGAFALHVTTAAPCGLVTVKGGPLMASSDVLRVRINGSGGHASAPHLTIDPVPIACEIVQAFHTMVSRRVDVFDPAVVTISQINAGTTNNVISAFADIVGTIRTVSERTRDAVHARLTKLAEGIAAAHDATADVTIERVYPVTVNDPPFAARTMSVAAELLGQRAVHPLPNPVMASEDFSLVLNRVPGAMAFLGATPPGVDPRTAPPNHAPNAMFDEMSMIPGIALYAAMALDHLTERLAEPAAGVSPG
jgi:amidohydrolase